MKILYMKNIAFIPMGYVNKYYKKFVDLHVCNVWNVTLFIQSLYMYSLITL